jgi:hypothetical protein
MGLYGLNSALTNTMCFEDGGALTNGQYLNGDVSPESCAVIRRCLIDERYLYAHIVVTHALDPKLNVRRADRIFIFDRKAGVILVSDAFEGERAIRFATHLHCSGSVTEFADGQYRLTGGQANLIAGIKSGSKGLSDEEKGEIFVQVLGSVPLARVVVEEPAWVPAYIYGLNNTGLEDISEGRFPRYWRWRLEATEPVTQGSFLVALSPQSGQVRFAEDAVLLPEAGGVRFGYGTLKALGVECKCECLMWDETAGSCTVMGLRSLQHGDHKLTFANPVDVDYSVGAGEGVIYAQGTLPLHDSCGFALSDWCPVGDEGWKTHNTHRASFRKALDKREKVGDKA